MRGPGLSALRCPGTARVGRCLVSGGCPRQHSCGGTGTWALSKLVKQVVRRARPTALVSGVRTRGRGASGLGYLSGHAGVAVALGTAAFPRLGPSGRAVVAATVPIVGLSRIYMGAHLPLDVAGGAGLGLAVEAAVALVRHASGHKDQPDPRRFAPSR